MEVAIAVGSLKAAYHLVIFGIKLDQVPSAVRRCLELVRACHYDLTDLIKLRNESLSLLETKPAILERVNNIIENAHKGLMEVCQLVEKLRPAANDGQTPLMSRIEWLFFDSSEFTSQEPLIAAQHRSVIAELGFLRQLVLLTPILREYRDGGGDKGKEEKGGGGGKGAKWDNLALLDEMLGGEQKIGLLSTQGASSVNVNLVQVQTASVSPAAAAVPTEPPPPYSPPKENVNWYQPVSAQRTTASTFDTDGISLLFGDLKVSSTQGQGVQSPPAQSGQSTQGFYNSFIQTEDTGSNGQQKMWNMDSKLGVRASTSQFFLGGNTDIKRASTPNPPPPAPTVPGTLSPPPHQLHHRQSMPVINQAVAQPLSTIPQEMIHRYDGFSYSPPTQSTAPFVPTPPNQSASPFVSSPPVQSAAPFVPTPPPQSTARFVPSQAAAWNRLQQEKAHQRSGSMSSSSEKQNIYLQGNNHSSSSSLYLSMQIQPRPQTAAEESDPRRASTPNPSNSFPQLQPQSQSQIYLGGNSSNQKSGYNQFIPSAQTFPFSSHTTPFQLNSYAYQAQQQQQQTQTQQTPQTQYIHPQSTGSSTNFTVSPQVTGSLGYQVSPQSTGTSQFIPSVPSSEFAGVGLGVGGVVGLGGVNNPPRELRSQRSTIDSYFMDQNQLPAGIGYFGPEIGEVGAGLGGGEKTGRQEVRTEVYELTSVKFAPDPVELP